MYGTVITLGTLTTIAVYLFCWLCAVQFDAARAAAKAEKVQAEMKVTAAALAADLKAAKESNHKLDGDLFSLRNKVEIMTRQEEHAALCIRRADEQTDLARRECDSYKNLYASAEENVSRLEASLAREQNHAKSLDWVIQELKKLHAAAEADVTRLREAAGVHQTLTDAALQKVPHEIEDACHQFGSRIGGILERVRTEIALSAQQKFSEKPATQDEEEQPCCSTEPTPETSST